MPRGSSAVTPATAAAGYEQLVRRIRSIVMEAVRPGARLLVVTRGDDELLRFDNRVAWHFPRLDNGSYSGYHPASSEDAVSHLEELRERGAEYLVLPAPFFWWLEYYPALFDHLDRNAGKVWDDDNCVIFAFDPAHARGTASPLAQPIKRLLEALLPEGATVAVVTSGDPSLLALEGREAIPFPDEGGGGADESDSAAALAQLAELSERDDAFLVIPHVAPSWVDGYPQFLEEVEARYTCIARRERVCTLYELNGRASRDA
jgi:hypothetical protein